MVVSFEPLDPTVPEACIFYVLWAKKLSLGLFYLKLMIKKKLKTKKQKTNYANQLNFEHIMTLKCKMVITPPSLLKNIR